MIFFVKLTAMSGKKRILNIREVFIELQKLEA